MNEVMATVRLKKRYLKSGKWTWQLLYKDDAGKRRSKHIGTVPHKVAEEARKQLEIELLTSRFNIVGKIKRLTFSAFTLLYLTTTEPRKADSTITREKIIFRHLQNYLGDVFVDSISRSDGEAYFASRQVSPVTLNIELRHLKAGFQWGVQNGYFNTNPFSGIKAFKVIDSNLIKWLNQSDISALLNSASNDVKFLLLLLICLYTGCRRAEALHLTCEHIDLERNEITFVGTKSGKSRIVKINSKLHKALMSHEIGEGRLFTWSTSWVTRKFRKVADMAGLDRSVTMHTLRHTFCAWLVMEGVDLMSIKELLGHSSITVTQIYSHLSPDHLANTVEKLPY